MPLVPWPHRVTFMAPMLRLAPQDQPHATVAAGFLATVLFEHLARHPVMALTDCDDQDIDEDGRLLDQTHPKFAAAVQAEFAESRRDEVAWLELILDAASAPAGRLLVTKHDRQIEQFVGQSADGTLSSLIDNCLAQWLAARWLPPPARSLEPFTTAELLAGIQSAARIVSASTSAPGVAKALLDYTKKLVVPLYRVADAATRIPMEARILKVDPENPKALLHSWLARKGTGNDELRTELAKQGLGTPTLAELEQVITLAPQWGKGHLAMAGDDVPPAKVLIHQGIAAALMPRNVFAVDGYAVALRRAERPDEAWRISRRCSRLVPKYIPAHISAVVSLRECGRHGEAYFQTVSRRNALGDMWQPGRMAPAVEAPMREFLLVVSDAAYEIGALDEAARVSWEALAGDAKVQRRPERADQLERYQKDADTLAIAFGRDGHYRGDPGRVLDGYGKAKLSKDFFGSQDTARLVDAMVQLGDEELAPLVFARAQGASIRVGPRARLALARAHLEAGDLRGLVEELLIVGLAFPQAKLDTQVNRILRVAGVRFGVAEWEKVIGERREVGAERLARLIARDAADFVPGAERSSSIREALGQVPPVQFDRNWVEPLRAAMGASAVRELELLFHEHAQPTLVTADRLVDGWAALVAARAPNDPTAAAQLLYALAQSLCRYLALCTQGPTVLAGGYRQVAGEALLAVARVGVDWLDESLRPFLGAIEAATAQGMDWWLVDHWLLRVERALELDASYGGHIVRLSNGLRNVSALLRGDERIGFEHRMGMELLAFPEAGAQAREMLERCVRAFGTDEAAAAWGDAAEKTLDARAALDVRWTGSMAAPDGAGAQLGLGRALLQAGRVEQALPPLARGVLLTDPAEKGAVLSALRPLWEGKMDVPFGAPEAAREGTNHLRSARFEPALRCLRWAHAVDPSRDAQKNLGIALGRAGRVGEALGIFTGMQGEREGARAAAQALHEAKRNDLAARVHKLASSKYEDPEDWALLGRIARAGGDDETAAEAYAHAYHDRGGQLSPADLAAYAAALYTIGDAARCEEVATRLATAAAGDALNASAAQHALARVRLLQGRAAEAVPYAQQAVSQCPIPEVRKDYNETLALAQRGARPPVKTTRAGSTRSRALAAVRRGDHAEARRVAGSEQSWAAARAGLVAACLRGDNELGLPVATAAKQAADGLLSGTTAGHTDPDAAACRAHALEIRELALFAADPSPPLAPAMPREHFAALMKERRGG